MIEPLSRLGRRIGEPILDWFNNGGFETIVVSLGVLFVGAVILIAVLIVTNDLLGLGIFGQGTGCDNPDPYHPCRPVATR